MPDRIGWLLVLLLSACSFQAKAEDNAANETDLDSEVSEERRLGVFRRSIVIVDDAQRIASERFGNFMGQIDGFFSSAGTDDDAVSNESWARIRFDGVRDSTEEFEFDPSLKLRAVLPQTEQRLKLLFSTEDDDVESTDIEAVGNVGNSGNRRQNASLALRFIRTARERADVNLDIGVRQRNSQIQTFVRLNTKFRTTLAVHWQFSAANSYYYYSKSGFEDRLSFDFRRPLYDREDLFFRTFTEFNWRNQQKGAIIGQTVGLYRQYGATRALAYEALAGYHTSLNTGVSDRFQGHELRIRWRHNVWRPWFFYEIWPSLSWPSTNGYNRTEGLLLRAEFIIGQR